MTDYLPEIGTFSIRVRDKAAIRKLQSSVLDYKHLTNLLTILVARHAPKEKNDSRENFRLLTDYQAMKAVLFNNKGGKKTSEKIALINERFSEDEWLNRAKALCQDNRFNDKNVSMIIRRLKGEWKTFFTNIAEYWRNQSAFTGAPKPPGAKKLARVIHSSIPLEESKFSLKRRNSIGLTLGRRQYRIPFEYKGMIDAVGVDNIRNVKVVLSNGAVYLQFTYRKTYEEARFINPFMLTDDNRSHQRIEAGFDVGINNLGALFINSDQSKSLVICGKRYKAYNTKFNRFKAKLDASITEESRDNIKRGEQRYTPRGRELIAFRRYLTEKRQRFYDGEFNKLTASIVKYCLNQGVTDFVLSRNLSHTKYTGEIKQNSKNRQTFYQIPFGDFLNTLEQKLKAVGINVHDTDEAYTSKTSCITGDVNANQKKRNNQEAVLATDLNGSRVRRGLFKDTVINKVFNCDVGAAANHIKTIFQKTDLRWLEKHLFKLANPVKLKSTVDFDIFLNNRIDAVDKRACLVAEPFFAVPLITLKTDQPAITGLVTSQFE